MPIGVVEAARSSRVTQTSKKVRFPLGFRAFLFLRCIRQNRPLTFFSRNKQAMQSSAKRQRARSAIRHIHIHRRIIIRMTEPVLHIRNTPTSIEQNCRRSMTQIMETHMRKSGTGKKALKAARYTVRTKWKASKIA